MELLIQLIGFMGLACVVISFQKDRRSFTLIAQLLGALFFVIHFSLLQAYTGAIMNAISAARAYSFNKGNNIYTIYLFSQSKNDLTQ